MKKLLVDAVGLAGFGCLAAGLFVQFGAGPALMVSGVLLMAVAVSAAVRGGA
jgi:hypothetical protein